MTLLWEGWHESLAFVNCWLKEVLVSVGILLSVGQKVSSGRPWGKCLP